MLFFTQVKHNSSPIKRNHCRTVMYKQDKNLMYDLWPMNRVTVFYLCECTEDVSERSGYQYIGGNEWTNGQIKNI